MCDKPDSKSWINRLKNVPKSFVAYKRDCIAALDETKAERKILAPMIFAALLLLSCIFMVGAHYRGVDYYIMHSESFLNDYGMLKYVSVFSVGSSMLFGFVLFLLMSVIYIFTRLLCVKLFTRGTKAKMILLEGVIEFGMNSIPLTFFFLLGGVLSDLVWWSFYPLLAFFALFFVIMLIRSILDSVDRSKQKSLLVLVMTGCIFISLTLINVFMLAVMGYSLITIAYGVYENIMRIWDNIKSVIDGFFSIFS